MKCICERVLLGVVGLYLLVEGIGVSVTKTDSQEVQASSRQEIRKIDEDLSCRKVASSANEESIENIFTFLQREFYQNGADYNNAHEKDVINPFEIMGFRGAFHRSNRTFEENYNIAILYWS
jgi:hypothetical protein